MYISIAIFFQFFQQELWIPTHPLSYIFYHYFIIKLDKFINDKIINNT